jgi:hypothetical protein
MASCVMPSPTKAGRGHDLIERDGPVTAAQRPCDREQLVTTADEQRFGASGIREPGP